MASPAPQSTSAPGQAAHLPFTGAELGTGLVVAMVLVLLGTIAVLSARRLTARRRT